MGLGALPEVLSFLTEFARCEGTYLSGWNPLNTTLWKPGAETINSAGVRRYPNMEVGVEATIDSLLGDPRYGPLLAYFQSGSFQPEIIDAVLTWQGGTREEPSNFAQELIDGWRPPVSKQPTRAEMLLAGHGIYDAEGRKLTGEAAVAHATEAGWSAFMAIEQLQQRVAELELRIE